MAQQAQAVPRGRSNKRMHATAETGAVKFHLGAGRRVMRGVIPPERGRAMAREASPRLSEASITSACTRPATRCLSCFANYAGGRVMRGVRLLLLRYSE